MGGSKEEKFNHPTQKPVELMRRPILNHTKRGEVVYDPFLGSGTTLAAAEATGRVCYGLEIDPKYSDVIVTRWQSFTGKKAVLEGDGRTFDEIAGERQQVRKRVESCCRQRAATAEELIPLTYQPTELRILQNEKRRQAGAQRRALRSIVRTQLL
jgi:hypothetical protein